MQDARRKAQFAGRRNWPTTVEYKKNNGLRFVSLFFSFFCVYELRFASRVPYRRTLIQFDEPSAVHFRRIGRIVSEIPSDEITFRLIFFLFSFFFLILHPAIAATTESGEGSRIPKIARKRERELSRNRPRRAAR